MPKDILDGIIHKNKFKHTLSTLEFGYFSEVEIVSNSREIEKDIYSIDIEPEERPTIIFYGNTHAQLNSQIHDFVNWCFAQYGYDDLKQGGITYENMVQEFSYIESGIFSRMWKKVWLHIEDGKFVLVLYDVPQENKPIV